MILKRDLVDDPLTSADRIASADRILAKRTDHADAGIEWVLADREARAAQARFDGLCPKPAPASTDVDPDLQHAAAMFLETAKREHDALTRWKATARALVEALERTKL